MTTTVREWTGFEAKALRAALRMTIREFAGYLGVGMRTIAKWEARGRGIQPLPQNQEIMDTALAKASSDAQVRFTAAVSGSLASTIDVAFDPIERSDDADGAAHLSVPVTQSGVLLPVVIDGRQVLLPLDATTVAGRCLALAVNLAPSLGDASRLEAKPANLERAYELYLRGQSIGARTTLIRISWDMGWHERALEIGRATYEKNPDSLDATLAFARALNNAGMAEAALPMTLAALHVDPTNPTALKLLIWNHLMVGNYRSALGVAHRYLPTYPRDSNTRWAVASAYLGSGDVSAAIRTAREAITADPDDIMVWVLLGYLYHLSDNEAAARDAWSAGIEHTAPRAGTTTCQNLRLQAWLANAEACIGHTERARAKVAWLTEAEPHNGYIKYRLAHVMAELDEIEAAIRILREAVQDGFLSIQLLRRCDELLGLSSLVELAEYRRVTCTLRRNVDIPCPRRIKEIDRWNSPRPIEGGWRVLPARASSPSGIPGLRPRPQRSEMSTALRTSSRSWCSGYAS